MRVRTAMLAILTTTVGLVAACSGESTDDTSEAGIRLQVSGEPEEVAAFSAIAEAYQQTTSAVTIEVVAVAEKSDHLARLSSSFAAGNPPDVFVVNYREYAQFVTRGAIEPAGPLLDERGIDNSDYYPQSLDAFTYEGQLQCMPQNISSLVVYYNRTLFDRAGMEPPKACWSLSDLQSNARSLTTGKTYGIGVEPSLTRLAPFIWSAGGDVVDDATAPTRLTLDTPQARGVIQTFIDMIDEGSAPDGAAYAAQGLEDRFAAGTLAMLLTSRREVPGFREVIGLDFDVAPLPVIDTPASVLHSDAYCIANNADTAAAADFIAFAVQSQGQTIAALSGRSVPALKQVAKSPAFLDPSRPPPSSHVFLDAIPSIRALPVWPTWGEVEDVAEEELTRAYFEGAPLAEVLVELDERTQPILARGAS